MNILDRLIKKKIGLALGGGAARGLAHIGVLKVIEEEGIKIDFVAGTSVGSLIGALFCAGFRWKEINELSGKTAWKDLVEPMLPGKGLLRLEKLENKLNKLVEGRNLEELDIPLSVVTADITTGEEIILKEGPAARAVRASSSIPGIFEPVMWEDRLLVDGGLVNNVPASVVREMGAELVIAVDLNADRIKNEPPRNIFDVIVYSFLILMTNFTQHAVKKADYVIRPDLKGYSYYDLKKRNELINLGEQAARDVLARISEKIH